MKKIIMMLLLLLPTMVLALPTAKFTLLVVDENNEPIEGANASISFMKAALGGHGSEAYFVSGKTNKEGLFTGQGATEHYAAYGADADGYYGTSFDYKSFKGFSGILGFRKWQPWNPTLKVVLKKIKHPIAMYAYQIDFINGLDIPKKDEFIGYDLIKHDWVSPYGKGDVADFLFKLEDDFISNNDYQTTLSINFSNMADGLQAFNNRNDGSNFHSAHHAPLMGYQNNLVQIRTKKPNKRTKNPYQLEDGTNYYFRVRCDGDKSDSCLYGKLYGNIKFTSKTVRFKYFLNPSIGDTNIEFDPKKNLFKGLKTTMHNVTQP